MEGEFVAFLQDTLSPNPAVQQQNVATLEQWIAAPPPSVVTCALDIIADGEQHPLAIRQAAIAVLRRLVTRNPDGTLLVGLDSFNGHVSALLASLCGSENGMMTTAVASLIAAFMGKIGGMSPAESTDSLWSSVLGFVNQQADEAAREPLADAATCKRVSAAATLLHVLCEDCATQMQRWLASPNDSSTKSLALCDTLQTLLHVAFRVVRCAMEGQAGVSLPLASVGHTFTSVLAALAACFEEGVLPFEDPFADEDTDPNDPPGPAAAALGAVLARVSVLHRDVTSFASGVLFPWIANQIYTRRAEETEGVLLTALLKYLSLMVLAPGKAIRSDNEHILQATIPFLTKTLWPASPSFSVCEELEKAVDTSLVYVGDAALLANTEAFFLLLPDIFNALLPLAAYSNELVTSPAFFSQEADAGVPDDPRTVKMILTTGHSNVMLESDSDEDGDCADENPKDSDPPDKDGEELGDEGEAGTARRGLIANVINRISAAYENPGQLVEYLFPAASATLNAFLTCPTQNDPRVAEAVLFVVNDVVEECLSSEILTDHHVSLVGNVAVALSNHLASGQLTQVPFFVRQQIIRFLGRSMGAAVESLLRRCPSTIAHFLSMVPPDRLVCALAHHLQKETCKAVQKQCVAAISGICTAALQSSMDDLEDDDDSESDDSCGVVEDGKTGHTGPSFASCGVGMNLTNSQVFGKHLRSLLFAPADDAPIQAVFSCLLDVFPRLQLGPRSAVYDLYATVIPRMADHNIPFHPTAVGKSLEMLAVHCQSLGLEPNGPCSAESAYALVTISQVAAALGDLVAPAVPFFADMSRHVIQSYLRHQTRGGDLADMCELSLDLLSALSDALIDHDTLLPVMAGGAAVSQDATAALANFELLRNAFFGPQKGENVLQLCLNVLSSTAPLGDGASVPVNDGRDGLRRASVGLVYDALFMAPPEIREAAFWPLVERLVLGELASVIHASTTKELMRVVDAREASIANALLCLGGLLFLCGPSPAATRAMCEARPFLQHALDRFLAILADKGKVRAALPTNIRLNMANAASGMCALLASGMEQQQQQQQLFTTEGIHGVTRAVTIVSSELGVFTSSLEEDGCYECLQVLTGILRTLQAIQAVLHMPLANLFTAQSDLVTPTVKALVSVAKIAKASPALASAMGTFRDWVHIAIALQSGGAGAVQMTKAERQAITVVARLGPGDQL